MNNDEAPSWVDSGSADPVAAASLSMADVELTKTGKKAEKDSEVAALMNQEVDSPDNVNPKFGIKDTLVFGFAAGGILLSLMCMALNGGRYLIYIPMMITLFTSPYVAYQRTILRKLDEFREVVNQIREDVNRISGENVKLGQANDELEVQVNHLSDLEGQLDGIVGRQGDNAWEFMKSVKENKKVLEGLKEQMEARVLQDLISVLFQADRDSDYQIDPEEIDMLLLRFDNFTGVTYDADKFKAAMKKKGYNLNAVIDIVDNIFDKTLTDDQKIFKIDNDPKKYSY